MPERSVNIEQARRSGELNEHQKIRLRISCQYIDKLLSSMEETLHAATSRSPFPRFLVDVNPAQVRVLEDFIQRIRSQLLQTIAWQHMQPEKPDVPATKSILTGLAFVDIAIEELKPSYMRGSGPVPDDAVNELNGIVHELRSLAAGMQHYINHEMGFDLEQRLQKLQGAAIDVGLLRLLETVVTRNGLVELRPRIDVLTRRLEEDNFEVALFGRVSCGKSSLLNALLGTDVLPVGVNPITAVPTKLRFGNPLRAIVTFGNGHNEFASIAELAQLVTEQGNPGNLKNVVRAIVEVPSPRLKEGILLVDTPGLGSLARRGAAETLAYLPSCDLALLLIDAGTTLSDEDIGTLRLLFEAGIPALVLLSKADLLAEGDLHRAIEYIEQQIKHELGVAITVHTVSAMPRYSVLLDQFFERELYPRFEQARALRQTSVGQKIGLLREATIAALTGIFQRVTRSESEIASHSTELEKVLRVATGEVGEQQSLLDDAFYGVRSLLEPLLDSVAQDVVTITRTTSEREISGWQLSEWIHDYIGRSVQAPVRQLKTVGERAIDALQKVAERVGRRDAPTREDFESLLRDLPRFELAALPAQVKVPAGKLWGEGGLRARVRKKLKENIGPHLQQELDLYSAALLLWSKQLVRKLELLVNSHADAYRAQMQRETGLAVNDVNRSQVAADLQLLNNWKSSDTTNLEVRQVV